MKRGPADARMEAQDISQLTSLSKEHYAALSSLPWTGRGEGDLPWCAEQRTVLGG